MYQVLALKFRPRNFDELVGQQHVARTLANAIRGDRLAHAYVFAGQRGTGKTTVARILAKCLNCEEGPTVTPCDACAPCQEIAASRAMDVFEIDAASRTKVEQTRELLEMVSYAPVRDRHKIFIIDEVHMLSSASFNALLKTLEEPPPQVVFVLATTEIQKVLPTILSRCQVFEFRRVGVAELTAHLRQICEREEIRISDSSLERIARAGEGSVRDSLSFLERALAFCGQQIDDSEVLGMLGGVRIEVLNGLIAALARRDSGAMLTVLDGLVDEGHDLLHFWNELIAALRDLMLLRAVPGNERLLARPVEEAHALAGSAEGLTDDDLSRAFQLLADLELALKSSSQPRFMFESALIRLGSLGAVRPIEEVLRGLEPAAAKNPARAPEKAPARAPAARRTPQKKNVVEPAPAAAPAPPDGATDFGASLVGAVLEAKPMLGAILRSAGAVEVVGEAVEVRFASGLESLRPQLERRENRELIERQASRLAGRELRLALAAADATPRTVAAAPKTEAAQERPAPRPARRRRPTARAAPGSLIEKATSEPGVRRLLREFGAQVIDIRPLGAPDELASPEDPGPVEENP